MSTPRVAVVGSINLDLVATASRLPHAGETVGGARFARHPGGKGANQALAARRLGAEVAMFGCVGADPNADEALALLRADDVGVAALVVDADAPTGVALIIVSSDGENQIVVAPGANARFSSAHLGEIKADAMLCQLEIPAETTAAAMAAFEGFAALNLAPAAAIDPALMARADLLIVNESEAQFYGEALHGGSALVAVTYGARGAALYQRGQEIARVPAYAVSVIDTTGAGDTFSAALTLAIAEAQDPAAALAFACAAGALATTRAGAQPSLPWRKDVEVFLAASGKGMR